MIPILILTNSNGDIFYLNYEFRKKRISERVHSLDENTYSFIARQFNINEEYCDKFEIKYLENDKFVVHKINTATHSEKKYLVNDRYVVHKITTQSNPNMIKYLNSEIISKTDFQILDNDKSVIYKSKFIKDTTELTKKWAEVFIKSEEYKKILESFVTHLWLENKNYENLDFIKRFKSLVYLDLWNNNIQTINGIEECTELVDLNLQRNNIKNITPIKNLKKLKYLNLGDNKQLEGIKALKHCTELIELYLPTHVYLKNKNKKLLKKFKKLKNINLNWTCFTIKEIKTLQKHLPECRIYYNSSNGGTKLFSKIINKLFCFLKF
jgi:hypothetical protein